MDVTSSFQPVKKTVFDSDFNYKAHVQNILKTDLKEDHIWVKKAKV